MAVLARLALSRLLLTLFRLRRPPVVDEALEATVKALARRLGLRRHVRLFESSRLSAPMSFGLFRPAIGLPTGFAQRFAACQREAILSHELAHLAYHDPAWQMLSDLVSAAWWWHPQAWWTRNQLRAASEHAADEASLLVANGPVVLAECLVQLGAGPLRPQPACWLGIDGNGFRSGLGRRVERLMNLDSRQWRPPSRWQTGLAKTAGPLLLVSITILSAAWVNPRATTQGITMNTLQRTWKNSLAAFAVMTVLGPDQPAAPAADLSSRPRPEINTKTKMSQGAKDENTALGFDWMLGNVLIGNGNAGADGGGGFGGGGFGGGGLGGIGAPAQNTGAAAKAAPTNAPNAGPPPAESATAPKPQSPGVSSEMMRRYGMSAEMMRRYGLRPPEVVLGRQEVQDLLERTVLREVKLPPGVPLSEVVKYLDQETRQLDPQRRGLNFIISSEAGVSAVDPNTGLPMAAPDSADLNNVTIKSNLRLRNLRLKDVLEALTKLADRPIKYTVADYGVVFGFRHPGDPEQAPADDGGQTLSSRYRGMTPEMMRRYGLVPSPLPTTQGGDAAITPQKQVVQDKLEKIVLEELNLSGMPLGEVAKVLDREARARDPEKLGLNFLISEWSDAPTDQLAIDPTTGRPLPAQGMDLGNIAINFNLPLHNVRLKDALEAVTKVASRPIKYSVADYGVIFAPAASGPAPVNRVPSARSAPGRPANQKLEARAFRLDLKTFARGLERTFNIKVAGAQVPAAHAPTDPNRAAGAAADSRKDSTDGRPAEFREAMLQLADQLGVKFRNPQQELFYNDVTSILMVRAPAEDLATLQAAIESLGGHTLGEFAPKEPIVTP